MRYALEEELTGRGGSDVRTNVKRRKKHHSQESRVWNCLDGGAVCEDIVNEALRVNAEI